MKGCVLFLPLALVRHATPAIAVAGIFTALATAQEPLHVRIDRVVEAAQVGQPAPVAGDAEFVRRIYLDLTGRIPTSEQARTFLADPAPDKRALLINRLLDSPNHLRYLTTVFDVMLMERRPDKNVPTAEWRQYLYNCIATNKPFLQMAREMLSTDGADPAMRPAAKFYLDREGEPNLLTRDVGRMFFGHDVQCAQCHDHPIIDDYLQSEYYGLFAFFSRTSLFIDAKDNNKAYLAEKADGDVTYKSVFTQEEGATKPSLPGGQQVEEPVSAPGDEYVVKPDKDVRSIPKYSRRTRIAEELARADNRAFNRNIANRLWSVMLGRGIVEPVNLHHSGNPPSNAELLDLLGDEIAATNYDVKNFLREIAQSRVYQRSLDPPHDWQQEFALVAPQLAALEQAGAAAVSRRDAAKAACEELRTAALAKRQELTPQRTAVDQAKVASAQAAFAAQAATATLTANQQQMATKQPIAEAVQAAAVATKVAAEKLPGDAETAGAAAKFQAQAEKLSAELVALQTAVPEQTKVVTEATQAHEQAQQTLTQATSQYDIAAAPLHEIETKLLAAENNLRLLINAAQDANRRVSSAQTLADAQPLLIEAANATKSLAELQQNTDNARTRLSEQEKSAAAQQAALAQVQQTRNQLAEQVANLGKQLSTQQEANNLVTTALVKLREANTTLANDTDLASATQSLAQQEQRLTTFVASLTEQNNQGQAQLQQLEAQVVAATQAAAQAETQTATVKQEVAQLEGQLAAATEKSHAADAALREALTKLEDTWTNQLSLAPMRALTPEQLTWSTLQASGVLANYETATTGELKGKPEMAALPAAQFELELEKAVYGKLESNATEFVRLFGAGPGQPQNNFFATVDQALFMANGGFLRPWLVPSGDNLTARLLRLEDPTKLSEELYLSVLTRLPTAEETAAVASALAAAPQEKPAVVQELAWALCTSAEFRFSP